MFSFSHFTLHNRFFVSFIYFSMRFIFGFIFPLLLILLFFTIFVCLSIYLLLVRSERAYNVQGRLFLLGSFCVRSFISFVIYIYFFFLLIFVTFFIHYQHQYENEHRHQMNVPKSHSIEYCFAFA